MSTLMKYMIVAHPRSGSNLLSRALDSHPEIINMGELFGTNNHKGSCRTRIEKLKSVAKDKGISIYGAKILYFHYDYRKRADEGDLWDEIESEGFRIIHLTRKSWFEGFVSFRLAQITKKWVGPEYHRVKGNLSFEVDLENLATILGEWRNGFDLIESRFKPYSITYEDMCSNWTLCIRGVLDYLGAKRINLPQKIRKQMSCSYCSVVKNYDEVISWMKQNGFSDRI